MKTQDRKEIDVNGFWLYPNNPISKVGVFEYLGTEIGATEPNKIYRVYRPEEELSKQETIDSFELMPLLDDHTFLGNEGESPERVGVQGAISNIHYEAPYLKADIIIYSDYLKKQIQSGKAELSPSYRCQYVFESGTTPEGERYDVIQTCLTGNHLALVERGRTGPDVRVNDSCPVGINNISDSNSDSLTNEVLHMEFTKEQLAQIKNLIKEVLAENAAVDEEVKEDVKDETIETPEELTEELEEVKQEVEEAAAISQEVVQEALEKVEELEDKVNQVADAKTIIQEVNKRNKLIERVVPFIGVFDSDSMITEQDVAVYACDKLNIKAAKGTEVSSLNGYLQGAKLDKVMDSKIKNPRNSLSKLWSK